MASRSNCANRLVEYRLGRLAGEQGRVRRFRCGNGLKGFALGVEGAVIGLDFDIIECGRAVHGKEAESAIDGSRIEDIAEQGHGLRLTFDRNRRTHSRAFEREAERVIPSGLDSVRDGNDCVVDPTLFRRVVADYELIVVGV